ncbi:MAG: DUF4186 domain-containing protein [Bacilli bacterium]|nr:DUF4186 domain-containing protein [Bacilli bacterium]
MNRQIDEILNKLSKSTFRSSFHLRNYMISYIDEKGMDVVRSHATDFVNQKLGVYDPKKDGKQTPMKNHPVFIAMHACAFCCRGCLEKWYQIPKERDLTEEEKKFIVKLLMTWIEREYTTRKK